MEKWQSIIEESDQELKNVNNKLDEFKNKLLLNKFDENWIHVNRFKNIKIETDKIVEPIKINKYIEFLGLLRLRLVVDHISRLFD